ALPHPGALDALRSRLLGGDHEHVTHSHELFGAGRVDDDPAVGLGCDAEGETARDVGLDDTGDDVHGGPLRGDHEVDAHRTGHLGDADDGLLDFAARHHHQVVELVDHHHD